MNIVHRVTTGNDLRVHLLPLKHLTFNDKVCWHLCVYKAVAYLCKMEPMAKFRYATISI